MCDYIGLDVSVELTHICVVASDGSIKASGVARSDPGALAGAIRELSAAPELVVLETGGQSSWLQQGLEASGLPAVIVDARQARAVRFFDCPSSPRIKSGAAGVTGLPS